MPDATVDVSQRQSDAAPRATASQKNVESVAPTTTDTAAAQLLFLQRAAGNRAVAQVFAQRGLLGDERTPRQKIDDALKSLQVGSIKDVDNFRLATPDERMKLLAPLLTQSWVGPNDEKAIFNIWETFGDGLSTVVPAHLDLWAASMKRSQGTMEQLPAIKSAQVRFLTDVKGLAVNNIAENRKFVVEQQAALGLTGGGVPTADQQRQIDETIELVQVAGALQNAAQKLLQTDVGYDLVIPDEGLPSKVRAFYDPGTKPDYNRAKQEGTAALDDWKAVDTAYQDVQNALAAMTKASGGAFAAMQTSGDAEGRSAAQAMTAMNDPVKARAKLQKSFGEMVALMDLATTRIVGGKPDYRELKPLHRAMFKGQALASGNTYEPGSVNRSIAEYELKDYADAAFWEELGIKTLEGAAFVVLSVASGGSGAFLFAAAVGLTAATTDAAAAYDRWEQLDKASKATDRAGLQIVDRGQVIEAGKKAVEAVATLLKMGFAVLGGALRRETRDDPDKDQPGKPGVVRKPRIPDEEPANLREKLSLDEARSGQGKLGIPEAKLNDKPRLDDNYGPGRWVKMEYTRTFPDTGPGQLNPTRGPGGRDRNPPEKGNTVSIHWFKDEASPGKQVEFKFDHGEVLNPLEADRRNAAKHRPSLGGETP